MDNVNNNGTPTTEQRILDAAITEFGIKGFDGARTASIAAAAGVTHAMLHYFFRTKEGLFKHIFEAKVKDIMDLVLSPVLESRGSIKVRLRLGIEAHFDRLRANSTLPLFFITTLNSRPDLYAGLTDWLHDSADSRIGSLQKEFDKACEEGEIRHVDAALLFGDIASLNLFPFIATPIFMAAAGYGPEQRDEFLDSRREENVRLILDRISC